IWCWQQTLKLDPDHPQIEFRIAQALRVSGQAEMAKEYYLSALRTEPGNARILMDFGLMLLENNELGQAREKFYRVLEQDPENAQAHHYLGEIYLQKGRIARAIEFFINAINYNRTLAGPHFRLGQCYLKLGQIANAREHLIAEYMLDVNNSKILNSLGCMLEEVGASREAISCLERAACQDENDFQTLYNLSLCYYRHEMYDFAISISQQILQMQPDHGPTLYNIAYSYLKTGQYDNAMKYAQRGIILKDQEDRFKRLYYTIKIRKACESISTPYKKVFQILSQTK
ncbi:MAG: tetratricopeptide repeat protein, partial [Sedimentisphaerales bacterium]|nr:tetratricopeptide repeat protein [Sedimentisphaerales bacterium]